jgi:hypothetical protein
MAAQELPDQHATTSDTSSNTTEETDIRCDPLYVRTIPGMLKVAQIVLNLSGFICITASFGAVTYRGNWFCFVATAGLWITGILLSLYLFRIVEKFHRIPWLKIEFVFCTIWTLLYLLAAFLAAANGSYDAAFAVAAFFGFAAMVAYGYDAILKFKAVRSGGLAQGGLAQGELAQGEPVVTESSSTVTSPA